MAEDDDSKKAATNIYDVLIAFINAMYSLINGGNIIGVLLFIFGVEILTTTLKLTSEDTDKYVDRIFTAEFVYAIPMGIVIAYLLHANRRQRKTYKREIERLRKERKELIHGLTSGELKPLEHHHSSGIDPMEDDND